MARDQTDWIRRTRSEGHAGGTDDHGDRLLMELPLIDTDDRVEPAVVVGRAGQHHLDALGRFVHDRAIGAVAPKAAITGPIGLIGLTMFLYGIGTLYGRQFFDGLRGPGLLYNALALGAVTVWLCRESIRQRAEQRAIDAQIEDDWNRAR